MVDVVKNAKWSIDSEKKALWNKMNQMVTQSLQWELDLEANRQVIEQKTKDNLENGEDYVVNTKTPYWNLMLDRRVMRTEERHVGHRSFLP